MDTSVRAVAGRKEQAGVAARCRAVLDALAARGPLSMMELYVEIGARLRHLERTSHLDVTVADDVQTLTVGGWIERFPADPQLFTLSDSGRSLTTEVRREAKD